MYNKILFEVFRTARGVPDLAIGSCEKKFIELLNAGIQVDEGQTKNSDHSRKEKSMTFILEYRI